MCYTCITCSSVYPHLLQLLASEKLFLQVSRFLTLCVLKCLLRFPARVKLFPHVLHVYGLSPVCILMCALSVPASVSLFPHMLHVYGLSWYLGRAAVQGFGVVLTSQWTHSVFIRGLVKSPGYRIFKRMCVYFTKQTGQICACALLSVCIWHSFQSFYSWVQQNSSP